MSKLVLQGVLCVLLCTLLSCQTPEHLSEEELISFVHDEDNGLSKTLAIKNIKVTVTYKPTDLLVAQELRVTSKVQSHSVRDARMKYQQYYYFLISFSSSGREILDPASQGLNGFSDLLQTISFRMSEVVCLTIPKRDTIAVADYVHNRTFGMGSSTDLLFVFDKSKVLGQETVHVNLDEFGLGIGKQSFVFNVDNLEASPKIFEE